MKKLTLILISILLVVNSYSQKWKYSNYEYLQEAYNNNIFAGSYCPYTINNAIQGFGFYYITTPISSEHPISILFVTDYIKYLNEKTEKTKVGIGTSIVLKNTSGSFNTAICYNYIDGNINIAKKLSYEIGLMGKIGKLYPMISLDILNQEVKVSIGFGF